MASRFGARGEILEMIEERMFKFTFGKKEKGSNEYVTVTIEFDQENDGSLYTLTQENMGGPDLDMTLYHLSCNLGWIFFMTNMKAFFEYGIDLREHHQKHIYVSLTSQIKNYFKMRRYGRMMLPLPN